MPDKRGHLPDALAGALLVPPRPGGRVNAAPSELPEPVDPSQPATGSALSATFQPVLDLVLGWAGDPLEALVLSGSHATGEAVWAEFEGHRLSLSDLDLYAVMRDDAAVSAALRRREGTSTATFDEAARLAGLAGPLEVAFVTREGLARMPARPGSVELIRSGRVLVGDERMLERLPHWRPAGVSAEERLLLIENRAFELLWAWHVLGHGLQGLRAQHVILKTALDLAAARTLAHGQLPARSAERVAVARSLGAPSDLPSWLAGAWEGLDPLWETALAWRSGRAEAMREEEAGRAWRAAVRAWSAAWWAEQASPSANADPWERALDSAARGSLLRRLRRSLRPVPGVAAFDSLRSAVTLTPSERLARRALASRLMRLLWRVRHAWAGTPLLRIHGTAVVLLLAAAQSTGEPVLPAGALRALRRLGVTRESHFSDASRVAVAHWGRAIPSARTEQDSFRSPR